MLKQQAVLELGVQTLLTFAIYFSELAEAQLQSMVVLGKILGSCKIFRSTLPFDLALGGGTEKEFSVKVVVNDEVL